MRRPRFGIEPVYRRGHEAGVAFLAESTEGWARRPRYFLATFTNNLMYLCAGFPQRSVRLGPQRIGTSELADTCYP